MKPTQSQQQAIDSNSENILVIAGAGSGKTATVVARICRLIAEGARPSSILCLTFTRKAALELKERIAKKVGESAAKKIWAGTFHSISYRILMQWGSKIGYQTHNQAITVITPEESEILLKEISKSYDFKEPFKRISEAKALLAHDNQWPESLDLQRIIQEYQTRLKECNAVDFDSLLLEVQKLFEASPAALEHYQKQFDHIFVDEYQDTDKVQYNLHELLRPKHLFAVGDANQSIYSWRGANLSIIMGFENDHPGADVIKLENCFRCGDAIVEKANNLIRHNRERVDLTLIGSTGRQGIVEVEQKTGSSDIAHYLAEYLTFENPAEIAVISRTHSKLERIEKACLELGLDVLRVGKASQDIASDVSFKFLQAYLRLRINSRDNIAFITANNIGFRQNLKEIWQKANATGRAWFECYNDTFAFVDLASLSVCEFYQACCEAYEVPISEMVKSFLDENWPDTLPAEWLKEYQLRDNQVELEKKNHDKITLLTGHAAKGLEWDNVLIADFKEENFPSKQALRSDNLEEERRLAYVAFTRARERLLIFTDQEKPSRFIAESGCALDVSTANDSLENKIAIVDIETTGFMPTGLIVEVGIVELNLDTGNVKPLYNSLVREPGFCEDHKDSWIFKNSDLTFEQVQAAMPLDCVAIQGILSRYPATAYNNKFDFSFLESRGINIDRLDCPMLLATNICKIPGQYGKNKWPTVEEAWRHFFPDQPYIEKHRGLDDAIHEASIVYELYKLGVFKLKRRSIEV